MLKYKTIVQTLNNKKKAIKILYDLFPQGYIEQDGDSFNNREFSSFYVHCEIGDFVSHVNRFYTKCSELFDFSRPRIIEKDTWIYKSSYFTAHFGIEIPYKYKDGTQNIVAWWNSHYGISWGLKDWNIKYKEIYGLLNDNPNEELRCEYKNKVVEADKLYKNWKKEIDNVCSI